MIPTTSERAIIERVALLRSNLIELVVVAVLVGFGVGLAASSVCSLMHGVEILGTILGASIGVGALSYLFPKVLTPEPQVLSVEGFLYLVETKKTVQVRPVHRYELSEKISDYLHAAFSENPALLRAWINSPVRCVAGEAVAPESLTGNSLLNQAIEYFFLDCLSLHLEDYFQEQGLAGECQRFAREHIPDVLLRNRFLEMFSRPMEEREQFSDHPAEDGVSDSNGTVVCAVGEGGALFDKFELVLPTGSKVSRSEEGTLRIETAAFSLEFSPGMEGFSTVLPPSFEELYMGERDLVHAAYFVRSQMTISVKRRALFSRTAWQYYRWLDSFVNQYHARADVNEFLKAIAWESAVTVNRISLRAARSSKGKSAEQN